MMGDQHEWCEGYGLERSCHVAFIGVFMEKDLGRGPC